ncbi:hypothetical protein SAMN04489842_1116 [Natronobacterium texcoconense]|uniref:Zinc-ribbon domain-containing protein n=1 Tax=Natronobacterium texcoconense TaxID=1095778 RepID=A0A1H1BQC6_NATTX|nr:hypothetical protein SAMN04489842_1116 [Natronobacterium texcoconense]
MKVSQTFRNGSGKELYECRNCGKKLAEDTDECPNCSWTGIAHYEF